MTTLSMKTTRKPTSFRALMLLGSLIASGSASAAPNEADPVWRAEVRVRVCDRANAGSGDAVFASLAPGNSTRLNHGGADFGRNQASTYDALIQGVTQVTNVTRLRISKNGTDGVCIRSVELKLNGLRAFLQDFGANGRFLDGATTQLTITNAELRANPAWQTFEQPVFGLGDVITLSRAELESRVEAAVSTAVSATPVDWGDRNGARFIEAARVDATTEHVDLDLRLDTMRALSAVPNPVGSALATVNGVIGQINNVLNAVGLGSLPLVTLPTRPLDVDFDLVAACADGEFGFAISEPVANLQTIPNVQLPRVPAVPGLGALVGLLNNAIGGVNAVLDDLHDAVETFVEAELSIDTLETDFVAPLGQVGFGVSLPPGLAAFCPDLAFQTNGDLTITLPSFDFGF